MPVWTFNRRKRLTTMLKEQEEGTLITCGDKAWVKSKGYWEMGTRRDWVDTNSELAERLIWLGENHGLRYTLY